MRKFLMSIILFLSMFNVYGQEFILNNIINNPDCIYGCGVADRQEEAEQSALLMLASSINTKISSRTLITVDVKNGDETTTYHNNTVIESDFDGDNTHIYVYRETRKKERPASVYVYRYIYKSEYIKEHIDKYQKYMDMADTYEFEGRGINLKLGAYYFAYQAIDTKLMDILNNENKGMKDVIKRRIGEVYSRVIGVNRYGDEYRVCVWGMGDPPLYSFEYKLDGKWKKPTILSEKYTNVLNNTNTFYGRYEKVRKYVSCYIPKMERRDPPIRIMFDKIVGDEIVQIDVPEKWYMIGWLCG